MACLLFRGVVSSGGCAERVLCVQRRAVSMFFFFLFHYLYCSAFLSYITFSFGSNKDARYMHVCEANLMISSIIVDCVNHTVLR